MTSYFTKDVQNRPMYNAMEWISKQDSDLFYTPGLSNRNRKPEMCSPNTLKCFKKYLKSPEKAHVSHTECPIGKLMGNQEKIDLIVQLDLWRVVSYFFINGMLKTMRLIDAPVSMQSTLTSFCKNEQGEKMIVGFSMATCNKMSIMTPTLSGTKFHSKIISSKLRTYRVNPDLPRKARKRYNPETILVMKGRKNRFIAFNLHPYEEEGEAVHTSIQRRQRRGIP